ncbi:MAG TPA: ParB/RepB/Spo0J family partition protein [Caulobacteraceae bacterium]|nr:ParB/RepB/Spo0J family partition protein [Caulobacteraceae bacterium]
MAESIAAEGRRGLGRGLSALLGEADAAPQAGGDPGTAREIPIELIRRNPDQPRRTFAEAEIEELAASIREKGVLQPVLVRPAPDAKGEYQLVAGERRWRASQKAGLRSMPALVRDLDDGQVLEIGIVENVQRADLNPLEEALGYRALMEKFGRTQEAVAQVVGKSRPHVANALRLLSLPTGVQAMLADGRITAGHARAIAGSPDPTALANQVVARGLNVRETEALVRRGPARPAGGAKPRKGGVVRRPDVEALESDIAERLGLKVELRDRGGPGELTIHYASLEQFEMVLSLLMRR